MTVVVERVVPGESERVRLLRQQVLQVCCDLSVKTVLLRGPIGAGKSTVARAIGYLRRMATLTEPAAKRLADNVRFDAPGRIDFRIMTWYVELALTGLSESLADSQLFGVGKKVATDVEEKLGVFELAKKGRAGGDDAGAAVTGGIVFLDEIADLPTSLQGKLLPVLSGGVFYRLGGEGIKKYELTFDGVTVVASWKAVDKGALRADLLSRVTQNVIDVPGIGDRREDLGVILTEVENSIIARRVAEIERICGVDPEVDRGFWREHAASPRRLTEEEKRALIGVDWTRFGNIRGLTHAVEKVLRGVALGDALATLIPVEGEGPSRGSASGPSLLAQLLSRTGGGGGLAGQVREIELEQRRELRELLQADPDAKLRLAEVMGLEKEKIDYQAQQLDRARHKGRARRRE